jgi:branched-chain amino acid transport system ATP-binding protein
MALLEIRNLDHYFGGLRAVQGFNLSLHPGELLGLIGPNGAGKTTIFNLVSGFYRPTGGEILFEGKRIGGVRPHQITALGISRTFQNIRLWNSMTVLENLCVSQHCRLGYGLAYSLLGTGRYRDCERKVLKNARDLLDMLGLAAYADEQPRNLAYGLQRRVEICRALAAKPKLLLLDEPAAGINPGEIEQLISLIRWVREQFDLTVWLIEHQMKVVMSLCERITVLDFGETIAEGTPGEVRRNPRVIKAYLGDEGLADA